MDENKKPELSDRFDADDIRKLRDYNSERHSKMSRAEVIADIKKGANELISSTFAPNYLALTTYEIRALCVNKCVKNSVLDTALSTAISLHMPLEMERINKHLP